MIANLNSFKKISAKILLLALGLLLPAAAQAGTWTWVGPDGGHIGHFAVSPSFSLDKTVFVATSNDGVHRSKDGGKNWSAVNSGLNNLRVNAVVLSPNFSSDHTAYVGTVTGVFKSTNGGQSWKQMSNGLTTPFIQTLGISPSYSTDSTLLAGSNGGGIFKSTDGGDTWTAINGGLTNLYINGMAVSPAYSSDGILYAGTDGGVFKSVNRGATWAAVNSGVSTLTVTSIVISPAFSTDQTVYAGTLPGGVFKTINGGTNWTAKNTGLVSLAVSSLSISPTYSSDATLVAGTIDGGVYKTINGGTGWTTADVNLANHIVLSLSLSSDFSHDQTFFVGTEGHGVYKSTDGGNTSHESEDGIRNLEVEALKVSPNFVNDGTVFIGLEDRGIYKTSNGGSTWTQINTGLSKLNPVAMAISPGYAADSTVFAGFPNRAGIYKSINGGNNWAQVNSGIAILNVKALEISPNYTNDHTLFAGMTDNGGVYKSTDGGSTWTASNSGLTNLRVNTFGISSNFANDQTLFAGTAGGGVFKSINGGSTWTAVNSGVTDLSISSLALSPNYSNDSTLFVGTASAGVFKSVNKGGSWVIARTGLGSIAITSLAISPQFPAKPTLFAGTPRNGVFQTLDSGGTWIAVNHGLGNLDVKKLAVSPGYPCDGTLFAGTDGSSGWRYSDTEAINVCNNVPPPPPSPFISGISPSSGNVNAQVTITGSAFGSSGSTSAVLFNGAPAGSIVSWSDTQIIATVPSGATTGPLVVKVNGVSSNGVTFTVTTPPPPSNPVIDTISPLSGVVTDQVTITGSNFGSSKGTSKVWFNGTEAVSIVSWSGTQIIATVPLGATTGPIVVIVNTVSSNGVNFTVNPILPPPVISPVISAISPSSGIVTTPVTLTGTDFGATQGSSSVLFNGAPAGSIVSWSDTQIIATVPSGATTGPLKVTVNGNSSNEVTFTVTAPPPPASPFISGISPVAGYSGTPVTITGSAFGFSQGTSAVLFNGLPADSIVSWSDTQIIATVPVGAATGQLVVMVDPNSSNGVLFTISTVPMNPVITAISPSTAYATLPVTITGYGFGATQGSSTVTFDGVAATIISWSDTQIVVIVPNVGTSGPPVVTVNGIASTTNVIFVVYLSTESPDLTVYTLTASASGIRIYISDTEKNSGVQPAVPFNVSFYFSRTTSPNPATDTLIGTRFVPVYLASGGTNSGTHSFVIPPTMPIGVYYVCAISDSTNQVSETIETNNSKCFTTAYTISPDLKTSNIAASLTGMKVAVNDTQINSGNQPVGPFSVTYYLSAANVPNPATDYLIGSRIVPGLSGVNGFSSASPTLPVPPTMPIGNYYICAISNAGSEVEELVVNNNTKCTTATYAITPDLKTANLSGSLSGVKIGISDTQQNSGSQSAGGSFKVSFYFSATTTVNALTDTLIGSRNLIDLTGGGGNSSATTTVTIPPTMPIGNYYLCAISDSENQIGELDESNNTKCTAGTFVVSPDLKTNTITGSLSGVKISINDSQINSGDQPAGSFKVAYYLSATTTVNALTDTMVGSRNLTGLAGGGATSSATTTITIPPAMPIGNYYVCAIADSNNQVGELVENNNTKCTAGTYAVSPDLKVYSLTGTLSGVKISVVESEQNSGTQPAGSFKVTYYLSATTTVNALTDTMVGSRNLTGLAGGNATSSATTSITIPPTMPIGNYYVCAISDSDNQVGELVENNNTKCTAGTYAVSPNLLPSTLTGTLSGLQISVAETEKNSGTQPAGPYNVSYYLSGTTTVNALTDTIIGSRSLTGLAGGSATNSNTTKFDIPQTMSAGNYYVCAISDSDNQVGELVETNNALCATAAVAVFPDLKVYSLSMTKSGSTINVNDSQINSGDLAAGPFSVAFYLSLDNAYQTGDILLGTRSIASLAGGGARNTVATPFTVPVGAPAGTYYLIGISDSGNTVAELLETNNNLATTGTIILP
jgi:photosystem II stability/assembly factor-like uncharacterized protein